MTIVIQVGRRFGWRWWPKVEGAVSVKGVTAEMWEAWGPRMEGDASG